MDFNKLILECKKNEINDVEVIFETSGNDSFSLFDSEVIDNKCNDSVYANIRAKVGQKVVSYYAENLNDENISHIVDSLKDMSCVIDATSDAKFLKDNNKVDYKFNEQNDFATVSKTQKIEFFKSLTSQIKDSNDLVKHVRVSYNEIKKECEIKNSEGLDKKTSSSFARVFVQVVVSNNLESRSAFFQKNIENFRDLDTKEIIEKTVDEAIRQLGATSLESKKYKVVLKNTCMIELLKAFKDQFSSLALLNNMTTLKDKEGDTVFGKNVSIIDDPYKDKFNTIPFDMEGVDTKKKYIVKNGKFIDFMYNLDTGSKLNKESSGNGFKEDGIKGNVLVGPTNLYLEEGEDDLDTLFKKVENGVYITGFQGTHAGINPISGDFNLQSQGFLIENGVRTKPVTLIIVSGNFFDSLNDICEFGNDLEFRFGIGSPSLYFNSLNISGK